MSKSIVIIGDSPLSVLVARQLDRDLARQAHIGVTHLTRDETFFYSPLLKSLLGKQNFPLKKQLYRHVECRKTTVKQINLIDQRIVTIAGLVDYDVLFLDLTPSYTTSEQRKITQQVNRLINEVQAKIRTGRQLRARVTFTGEDLISWQFALALALDLKTYPVIVQKALLVQAQYPPDIKLKDFLAAHGVGSRRTVAPLPGLTINGPTGPLKNRLVRGALLDDRDNFILRNTLNQEAHPEVIIVDGQSRQQQNLIRADQTLAVQIATNINNFLFGDQQKPIDRPRQAGILSCQEDDFVWLNDFQSNRWRARIIATLDRRFYRQLIG